MCNFYLMFCDLFISRVYEDAETKSRQTLLRYQASRIADYEALYHIYLWKHEPEPRYIYYIGQSKQFDEWYDNIEKEPIYKELEDKSTFTKRVFKEEDYDRFSIWKYDGIRAFKKKKEDIDSHIEELRQKLNEIQDDETNKDFNVHIEELCKKLNKFHEEKMKKE